MGRAATGVRRGRSIVGIAVVLSACASPSGPRARDTAVHAPTSVASAERAKDAGAPTPTGRTRIAEPPGTELDFAIEPVDAGRSVLFVSQRAGDAAAFVRRQTDRGRGPLVTVEGAWVYGSFDAGDGTWALIASDGARLCIERRREDAVEPIARGCSSVAPTVIAALGDRLALVDAVVERPPRPPEAAPDPPRKAPRAKGPRKKRAKPTRKSGTPKSSTPPRPLAAKLKVDVRMRWASLDGVFESESRATGLSFKRPQEGLSVLDALGRSSAIDLLWASWVETKDRDREKDKKPGALGTARMVAGSLDSAGTFDPRSETNIVKTDLVWGGLDGHVWPRLVGTADATAYVARVSKGPTCRAATVAPAAGGISPQDAVCGADPWRLASREPVTSPELATYERLIAEGAKRTPAQLRTDVARAAWTAERGFWLVEGRLRSIARRGTDARDEPHPFPAKRSRVAWGTFDASGMGLAAVDGRLVEVDAAGTAKPLATAEPLPDWAVRVPSARPRVARIAQTWWTASGDVVRLAPAMSAPEPLRGRGHPDATALVGGARTGLLLELVAGRLDSSVLWPDGTAQRLGSGPAPVRQGFEAVARRRGGGALVAGVDARDASRVVAVVVDESGAIGAPRPTTLPIRPGDLAVRLVPLPRGGAWLADAAGTRVVWLDDDGREIGGAPWPVESSHAACLDGKPARASYPSAAPSTFVRAAALEQPGTCAIDHPVWAPNGSLRSFVSAVAGTNATAEVAVLGLGAPRPGDPPETASKTPAAASPEPIRAMCPAEMVAITSRADEAPAPFCVDRFESMLVDEARGVPLSPDHPTVPGLLDLAVSEWSTGRARTGDVHARAMPLPLLPPGQRGAKPRAVTRLGARPSGYVSGHVAGAACAAAGKRLCSADEFLVACRGEQDLTFPYGDTFEDRACNVFRDEHPAAILHGNASLGHLDPRLNRVVARGEPLLRTTGSTPRCASRWGADAVYDMVGNVDEWVDEPGGAFAGGFYSRSTRAGCEALITAHPRQYLDYSTGVRCCKTGS